VAGARAAAGRVRVPPQQRRVARGTAPQRDRMDGAVLGSPFTGPAVARLVRVTKVAGAIRLTAKATVAGPWMEATRARQPKRRERIMPRVAVANR